MKTFVVFDLHKNGILAFFTAKFSNMYICKAQNLAENLYM